MSKTNGKDRLEGKRRTGFPSFDELLDEAKDRGAQAVLLSSPQRLGTTYEELIRNLTKLQEAGLPLYILPT